MQQGSDNTRTSGMPLPLQAVKEIRWAYQRDGVAGVRALTRYYTLRIGMSFGPGRSCPICGWSGKEFEPILTGPPQYTIWRARAICPTCGSKERHRACYLFLQRFLPAELAGLRNVDGRPRIVHFAPERCLEPLFRGVAGEYLKSNYVDPAPGELQLDLQALSLEDESCDVLVLSHVMVCIPDHRSAVENLFRVLRPGGLALVSENVRDGRPTEQRSQPGHGGIRRHYGSADLQEQFAPFELTLLDVAADLTPATRRRYGIKAPEYLLLLRKPA